MFGRQNRVVSAAGDALGSVSPYVDRLAHDEQLRGRLSAALSSGAAARARAKRQVGITGLATRLATDPVLRSQVADTIVHLQKAKNRIEKRRSHKLRNTLLVVAGAGLGVAAAPKLRDAVARATRRGKAGLAPDPAGSAAIKVEQEIEVAVPVRTAYDQWTQFEQFPTFMEGIDEVKQLDDTLLHWAATVAGKKAEWDAKIVEQVPDRRIAWQSVDGRQTSGTVSFEPAGSGARTRIRLHMSYTPDGVTERVGSAVGLDDRRVLGDLERFRDLIEGQGTESGGWRGEIKDGKTKSGDTASADTKIGETKSAETKTGKGSGGTG